MAAEMSGGLKEPVARVRVGLAVLLAVGTIAIVVVLDLVTTGAFWRVLIVLGACLLTVGAVFVLPADLRKRLGPVAAVFATAPGVLSAFLITPTEPASRRPAVRVQRTVDVQQMAYHLQNGPFNVALPPGLQAGRPERTTVGDPSAVGKLVAVHVPIRIPDGSPYAGAGLQIYAEVEAYPSPAEAQRRAEAQRSFLTRTFESAGGGQSASGFCVWTPDAWTCGGGRRYVYAETSVAPGVEANAGLTQDLNAALLTYADDTTAEATR